MLTAATIVAKTLNSKYYKTIAHTSKPSKQKFPLLSQTQQQTSHFSTHCHLNQNLIKLTKFKSKNHPLEDLAFEQNFNHLDFINPQQEEIDSCLSTKQTNRSQPNIQVDHVQTLQFQANSPIQDKLSHKRLTSLNAQCMSIFDGHGGNTLSEYASKKITQLIDSYLFTHLTIPLPEPQKQKSIDIIKDSIQWAYRQIEQTFCELLDHQLKTGNKDIVKIGTCAITCVIWEDIVIIANCGDSQAIIVTQDQTGLCYFKANQQLNTSNLDQLARIEKQFQGIDDQVLIKSKLNNKVYIKGILQPTRTLGDYYLKKQKYFNRVSKATKTPFKGPYVKYNPQFKVIPIKSHFRYLILASDGLWDFATKKETLKVIEHHSLQQNKQSHGFSEQQLNKAYIQKPLPLQTKKLTECLRDHVLQKCAKKKNKTLQQLMEIPPGERRNYCDDISIIAVSFRENSFQ